METKDIISSCSDSEEQQMQQMQDKTKESCMFIDSRFSSDYDGEMTSKYFIEYTRIEVQQFHDTLIQHLESVKKSIDERALHKRDSETTFEKSDECNSSGNDTDTDDTNIKPVYDEEPMADVQLTAECNVVAKEQQHAKQLDLINEERVYQDAKQCHDKRPFLAKLTKNKITKLSHQSLKSENSRLKNTVAQEYVIFAFASHVGVNNDLSKPVTPHSFPYIREYAFAKPNHVIAPSSSRNSSKSVSTLSLKETYGSNDMIHNYYLEDARKKTQERGNNSKPREVSPTRSQNTANGSKPKPRINNQTSRHWLASKSSCVQSYKTTNRNKPVEQISIAKKPERQITTGHRFSIKKTSIVHEKTKTPRSCLMWKLTSRIFKIVGLKWVPTGKIFTSSTTKVDCEPPHGSNADIININECKQTLDYGACISINVQKEHSLGLSACTSFNLKKERLMRLL
ncbi:hypothetical protein Tco_1112824 [Tanacetum coccineum]|uniref:Uncharacterized protein n=1 Tax=Tanacetum coccineum TaxID=301880 RepID=A0ABQ5IQE3_9ASTR